MRRRIARGAHLHHQLLRLGVLALAEPRAEERRAELLVLRLLLERRRVRRRALRRVARRLEDDVERREQVVVGGRRQRGRDVARELEALLGAAHPLERHRLERLHHRGVGRLLERRVAELERLLEVVRVERVVDRAELAVVGHSAILGCSWRRCELWQSARRRRRSRPRLRKLAPRCARDSRTCGVAALRPPLRSLRSAPRWRAAATPAGSTPNFTTCSR